MTKAKIDKIAPTVAPVELGINPQLNVVDDAQNGRIEIESLRPLIAEIERFAQWVPANVPSFSGYKSLRATVSIVSQGKRAKCYGHFSRDKWTTREGNLSGEIAIYGERLQDNPVDILGAVLHELVHAKNAAMDIDDCSASGRHNSQFKLTATLAGLKCESPVDFYGWGYTSLTAEAREAIEKEFQPNLAAFNLWRIADAKRETVKTSKAYICKCVNERGNPAFSLRVSVKVNLDATCNVCEATFVERAPTKEST